MVRAARFNTEDERQEVVGIEDMTTAAVGAAAGMAKIMEKTAGK
jgi:hypothetical protein